jgi:hypothetical protein
MYLLCERCGLSFLIVVTVFTLLCAVELGVGTVWSLHQEAQAQVASGASSKSKGGTFIKLAKTANSRWGAEAMSCNAWCPSAVPSMQCPLLYVYGR